MVKGREGKELNYNAAVSVCAEGPIQSLAHNPSAVPTGQCSFNEPEQPITNKTTETLSAFCFLCRFLVFTKRGFGIFGRLKKLDGNGWVDVIDIGRKENKTSVEWHKSKAD